MNTKYRTLVSSLLLLCGLMLLSKAFYMDAKAKLSQELIKLSWQLRDEDQAPVKPWPWADTHAIAEISVPRLQITQYIMRDADGQSLAFGPGHLAKSEPPASGGHTMIAGHRDSHFDFVKDLELGDVIQITHFNGNQSRYRISRAKVLDTESENLMLYPELPILTLVTCYPFDSNIPGGPLRWVVDAEQILH